MPLTPPQKEDKRTPKLEKIGCFFTDFGDRGFHFFDKNIKAENGDVFIYNKGILWRI